MPRWRLLWGCGACNGEQTWVTTLPPRKGYGEVKGMGAQKSRMTSHRGRIRWDQRLTRPPREPHLPKRMMSHYGVLFTDTGHGWSRSGGEGCLLLESLFNFLSGVIRSTWRDSTQFPTQKT